MERAGGRLFERGVLVSDRHADVYGPAPHARERTLPSLERVTAYGRHYVDAKYHGPGKAVKQKLYDLYMKPQMFYMPEKAETAWVEIPLEVEKKEPLRLVLNSTTAPDYGRYQVLLNGVRIGGPLDFYSDKVANTEFHLLDFWPDPGKYTVRLECVGKNAKSDGFGLGLESVNLRERRPAWWSLAATRTRTGRRSRRSTRRNANSP